MRIQKKILKTLLIVSFLIFIITNSKSITNSIRKNLLDLNTIPLKILHNLFSAAKKVIPFASLREENNLLRERLSLLTRKIEEAKVAYLENQRLKELLEFKKVIPYTTIPAQVIGRDPTNWSNSLIIGKGSRHGIRQHAAVLSSKGIVGRVLEVGRYSGKVLLISDPNSRVGVLIQRNRQGGILVGSPNGKCRMIYIALDSDVSVGDKVITAGFSSVFPKDIPVGEVVKVDREPGRLYKYAVVKTAQDLSRLEEVLCIR